MVLAYEHACRKKAYELVIEGDNDKEVTLKEALIKVTKDQETRQKYFIEKLQCSRKRASPGADPAPDRKTKGNNKGKGKGSAAFQQKGKGQGKAQAKTKTKGKGAAGDKRKKVTTDGKPICFKYNNGDTCDGSCGFAHVCQYCLSGSCKAKTCPKNPSNS